MRTAQPLYGALFKVCQRAAALGTLDRDRARAFFEDNFRPVRLAASGQEQGFYTGYYEPSIDGSRVKTEEYNVPLYTAPARAVKKKQSKVFANFDRSKIEDGALAGKGLEICYVKNPVDAFFAQIQGSTRVKLRRRQGTAAQLHRQQRTPLYAGRKIPGRSRHRREGGHVDGQNPRLDGSQP